MSDEYGVRHPDGRVTVHVTGHAFITEREAREEADSFDRQAEIDECRICDGGGPHVVVSRERSAWQVVVPR